MRRALIVTDVQNDFCEGGNLAVRGGAEVAFAIGEVLRAWQDADEKDRAYHHVVATRDHHIDPGGHWSSEPDFVDTWPRHCVAGTDGAGFHPNLDPQPFDAVFDKGERAAAYSGFEGVSLEGARLADWLRSHHIDQVDIVGLTADHCVRATAVERGQRGLPDKGAAGHDRRRPRRHHRGGGTGDAGRGVRARGHADRPRGARGRPPRLASGFRVAESRG